MDLTLSTCFVLVHDPDSALAFYRDALGLDVRNDVARGDFRWITVGSSAQPGVAIVLTNYLNGSPADQEALSRADRQGRAQRRPLPDPGPRRGVLQSSASAGAEVVQEPTDQPWGTRDFAVRDPSGNLLRDRPATGSVGTRLKSGLQIRERRPERRSQSALSTRLAENQRTGMGFADKLKDLAKKGQDEAATHKDQIHNAVLKAEQTADRQTGGQYHEQIVKAGEKADAYVDGLKPAAPAGPEGATTPPPASPPPRDR